MFLFYSNNKDKSETSKKTSLEKYVYIDTESTLHLSRYCSAIGKQPGELGNTERAVTRVLVNDVTKQMIKYTCSRCVSDEDYEQLKEIASQN